jgi:hypothetical protein
MDKAIEYKNKLEAFIEALNTDGRMRMSAPRGTFKVETGRKFDKVYEALNNNQKSGRYMIDRNSWQIFGIKSWNQHNTRRTYGSLDTVNQYDWSNHVGTPKVGSVAEQLHATAESLIAKNYKKRGRPRKVIP